MDYEKKYNEALKRARELVAKWTGKNKDFYIEDYSYIFPELRESEEETTRKELLDFVRSFWADHKEKLPQVSRWVTYLEKQKEQKPVEWSEENKKAWDALYKHFSVIYPGDGQFRDTKLSNRQITDFLKSLRPSWKPSEEQMKGLKFFLDFHRPQRNAGTTNWREYDAVESLYEQLKKL